MSDALSDAAEVGGSHPIEFTLDGVPHSTVQRRMTAGEILRTFEGLDPDNYALIHIKEDGEEVRFQTSHEVEIVPKGKYVSLYTGPLPVE